MSVETYIDAKGYLRFSSSKKLVHRDVYFAVHKTGNRAWVIHHINGIKTDNRIENLYLLPRQKHKELHEKWRMHQLPTRDRLIAWVNLGRKKKSSASHSSARRRKAVPALPPFLKTKGKERITAAVPGTRE